MKVPTREELDRIPVSDEEEREFRANIERVERALDKAHIPKTLDWTFVLLMYAAQRSVIQGMSREFFVQSAEAALASAQAEYVGVPETGPLDMPTLEHLAAKVKRLQAALIRGKVLPEAEATFYLVAAVARSFVRYGLPMELSVKGCEAAFTDAEARTHAMAQRTGKA